MSFPFFKKEGCFGLLTSTDSNIILTCIYDSRLTSDSSCWYQKIQLQIHRIYIFFLISENQTKPKQEVLLVYRRKTGLSGTYPEDRVLQQNSLKEYIQIIFSLASLENTYPLGDQKLPCKDPPAFCSHSNKLLHETLYFKDLSLNIAPHNSNLAPQSLGEEIKMNIQVSHSSAPQISCYEHQQ